MRRHTSTLLLSLEMPCPSISRLLRYFSCTAFIFLNTILFVWENYCRCKIFLQDERCIVPLIELASIMPAAAVPTFRWAAMCCFSLLFLFIYFSQYPCIVTLNLSRVSCPSCGVLSRLRRLDSGANPAQFSQLLDCICSWGQASDVLELITDWLTESLPKQGVSKRTTKKCFQFWMFLFFCKSCFSPTSGEGN